MVGVWYTCQYSRVPRRYKKSHLCRSLCHWNEWTTPRQDGDFCSLSNLYLLNKIVPRILLVFRKLMHVSAQHCMGSFTIIVLNMIIQDKYAYSLIWRKNWIAHVTFDRRNENVTNKATWQALEVLTRLQSINMFLFNKASVKHHRYGRRLADDFVNWDIQVRLVEKLKQVIWLGMKYRAPSKCS